MAKGVKMWCAECIFLDKARKKESENGTSCFRYGCNARMKDGYICGWIREDKELKTMGCSFCNRLKVGTKFVVNSRFSNKSKRFLYCGKIQGRPLLYCYEEQKCRTVAKDYLRAQTEKIKTNISIVKQNEIQFESSRRKAKQRRRRYIEDVEENMPFI